MNFIFIEKYRAQYLPLLIDQLRNAKAIKLVKNVKICEVNLSFCI